jgi:hypothetical protein
MSNIDEDRVVSEIRGDAEESLDDVPFLVRFHLNTVSHKHVLRIIMPRLLVRHGRSFFAAPRHYLHLDFQLGFAGRRV